MAIRLAKPRRHAAPAVALPGDPRWMNLAAAAVAVLILLGLLAAAGAWLARAEAFEIRRIRVAGDLARNNVPTLRATALPSLKGNFFSIDLAQARHAFEQVPWVRRAAVRRVWPDQLVVQLEEHRAVALWEDGDRGGAGRLVNSHGEVFDANLGDVEDDDLPVFSGPEDSSAQMLALWQRLQPAFAERGFALERLALSGRGSWRLETDDAATVELGRGSEDEVVARSERFLRTLPEVHARWKAPLEYADLRHADGYALRLRGVSTSVAKVAGTAGRRAPNGG